MTDFFQAINFFDILGFPIAATIFFVAIIISFILHGLDLQNTVAKYTKLRISIGLLILVLILPPFLSESSLEQDMRATMKQILTNEIDSKNRIYLNGKLLRDINASIILKELRSVKSVVGHHSIPSEHKFTIKIEYQKKFISFILEQDDKRAHEYWVHTDYFQDDKNKYHYIGRIYTDFFDIWTKPEGKNFY